ncbi:MAG: hypothetical protein WCF96_04375 [Eubacteriales bacterium]
MGGNRRVGTLTLGIVLILMGGAFIAHLVLPVLSLNMLLNFWPVVLILLGIETLVSYFVNKQERLRYDVWSIVIMIVLVGFSTCMGWAQFLFEKFPQIYNHINF